MRYARKTPEHIKKWSKEYPDVAETLHALGQEGIRAAVYCGTAAEIGRRSPAFDCRNSTSFNIVSFLNSMIPPVIHQQTDWRSHDADDLDLIVHYDDFYRAAELLNADVSNENRSYETADGYTMKYNLYVARAKLRTKVIEICHGEEPIVAQNDDHTIRYDWKITDFAADNFVNFKTRQGDVPLAHHSETLLLYGIIQRKPRQGKTSDTAKASMAEAAFHPAGNPVSYTSKRMAEMGVSNDDRLFRFEKRRIRDIQRQNSDEIRQRINGDVWREVWPGM